MTQKPRLEPLPPKRANRLLRAMYWYSKRRFGEVPEPVAVLAHHPRLLVAYAVHETMLQSASRTLPTSVRELAVLWTARTIGCSWCVDFGSMLLRLDGLDVERLKDIDRQLAALPRTRPGSRAVLGLRAGLLVICGQLAWYPSYYDEPIR